jgi:hypothetical protein
VAAPLKEAYARLCLTPAAPRDLVDLAFRFWAQRLHPDKGGRHEEMVELNSAVRTIRAHTGDP